MRRRAVQGVSWTRCKSQGIYTNGGVWRWWDTAFEGLTDGITDQG